LETNERTTRAGQPFSSFQGDESLHALIDTVPDAMVVIDDTGAIRYFSKGAETMFGYAESEVLGEDASLLMPSPDRERHGGFIDRYLMTGEKRIIGSGRATTARHRDGSTFPINISIGELKVDGTMAFVAFIRDLTESRQTQRELHSLQSELAHVSRISSMGSLATSLTHELNQPLTAVANYANSARDLLKNPCEENIALAQEAMDECAHQALQAGQIVHRMRDFVSRGESERKSASLQRLIQEASALSLMDGDGEGVDFETSLDPDLDNVLVDPIQIQQVVLNLLRNALEAMIGTPHKQLRATSRAFGEDATSRRFGENFVQITISDSGPGIEPRIADRLFHPFNSSKSTGMGVGLSICHSIIAAHGGKIWVEPSELGGTSFHFTVPLFKTGAADD